MQEMHISAVHPHAVYGWCEMALGHWMAAESRPSDRGTGSVIKLVDPTGRESEGCESPSRVQGRRPGNEIPRS